MLGYKFLDINNRSYLGLRWEPGVWNHAPGGNICTNQVLHCYAGFYSSIALHNVVANKTYGQRHLWLCEYEDVTHRDTAKLACKRIRILGHVTEYTSEMLKIWRYLHINDAEVLDGLNVFGRMIRVSGDRFLVRGKRIQIPEAVHRLTGAAWEYCRKLNKRRLAVERRHKCPTA